MVNSRTGLQDVYTFREGREVVFLLLGVIQTLENGFPHDVDDFEGAG
jgi:hypothetical protein